ncbi:probable disease resistance protein At5g47250 isoform X2 [Syzygium oleosum]|uniref:probable disease resistance protein At5g47250 isoform X2 n=1 Tax=Syzygium oleosum TaxID=219896 RepID=UPI0024B919D7|nr:probable disease resistance protein At5g47250 isoform X2 [Syzygium oleosum]
MSNRLQELIGDGITPDSPQYSTGLSYLLHSPSENLPESRDVIVNTSEEIQTNELHNPTVGSSLQIDSSLDVDGANRLQDCGQSCAVEVIPVRSNTSPTDTVQHPGQLPPRCDKEDGDDTRRFPVRTPMDIDPSTASQHTSDSHIFEATIVDSLVPEASTNTIGPSSSHDLDRNDGAPMTSHPNTSNNFEENIALKRKLELLYRKEASIRDELEFAASLSLKKLRMEVANWLVIVDKVRNDCTEAANEDCLLLHQQVDILMREAEDRKRQGKGLLEVRETKVSKLLEEKMVGEAFQRNTTKILEYLVGNQISKLGIYGMGGVGKTTIMVHIHNRLLEKANYGHVLWITVSQDLNTQRLQDTLGMELGLGILQEKDVRKRAAMLHDCLTKRGKSTIILDDVWQRFDLKEVGIPVGADGIKLVLTTRSFEVCRQMHCQEMIKIEPLSHIEAESLFLEELGYEVALNLETKAIVKSIVEECAGLPLAVITMARSMQGVTDVFEWKDCLEKLRESGQTDMEKEVLVKLEFSYNRLSNHEVQQCFLSCALYPEDKQIGKFELIELFIDQGLIDRLDTREKQYDRGLTILNKLENVCLLEDHGSEMKMHDLIRDMALHVMSATSLVKARKGLERIPSEEYWTDALEKVSLMENEIGQFPLNISPNCPKLSTFLLNANEWCDVVIPDSFFKQLQGLKVLNLSSCYYLRKLPDSISDLVNLRALLLRGCVKLRRIPYLGKLKSLIKLDLCNCFEVQALEGLEMLVNLRYLDLSNTKIKRLPKETLGALLNLQHLKVETVNGEDITELWALETLLCRFEDVDGFNKFARVVSKQGNNARYYRLDVIREATEIYVQVSGDARFGNCERSVYIDTWSHAIVSAGGEYSGICILIPQDVQTLIAIEYDGATNLFDMGLLENLEKLNMINWKNLRVLCGGQDEEIIDIHDSPAPAPAPTPTPPYFPSLRDLKIYQCPKLKYLFGHGPKFYLPHLRKIDISNCEEMVGITVAVTSPPPHPPPAFPSLEVISIWGCDKMKRVVESEWLPDFPNLRKITVFCCENVEEIIGGPPPYMPVEDISLESLVLEGCDNMRKLFPHEWMPHLRNLQTIEVIGCEGMVEMISGAGQGQVGSIMTPVNNAPSSIQSSISLPKLKHLCLRNLPRLKSICEVPITCDSMESLVVFNCPELNMIPLQLQLRDIKDLPYIEVEGEEKWKTLIWDHPDARAILQSHLLFRGSTCVLERQRNSQLTTSGSESPDAAFEEVC